MSSDGKSQCVLVGCDLNHEWMLPWWWHHFTKNNDPSDYHIVFGNYGMTDEKVDWCLARGAVSNQIEPIPGKEANWFKKPRLMRNCGYSRFLYMDLDCEIRRTIGPMFDLLDNDDNKFVTTFDIPTQFNSQFTKNPVTVGVIVSSRQNQLVKVWEDACKNPDLQLRGDQEVLNWCLANQRAQIAPAKVKIINQRYQWLRLRGEAPSDAYIYHWTGRIGKDHIQDESRQLGLL